MAVYTNVSLDELEEFLKDYDLGEPVSLKGIAEGVENSNYVLVTEKGQYILTLYEKRVAREDLPYFIELMDFLADSGIRCPRPIHGKDGEALRTLAKRSAAIISFLDGICVTKPTARHCEELGETLARFHDAGSGFKSHRANALGPKGWEPLYRQCEHDADAVLRGLQKLLSDELAFLADNWPADLPQGVIHADLFPDNVFFIKDKVSGLIDFYFACNDTLSYDLAICLNAWCFETDKSFNATKARGLLQGYQRVRPLSEREVDALPVLCRGAALRFLLTRLYDQLNQVEGAMVTTKNPIDYVDRLRFHQRAKTAESYGIV